MIGQTISHYKILEKLGEGGMGVVYKAEDSKLDRLVALKFLPSHLASSEQDKARFIQEAKAASALNHPNVCTIHDIQEHDGQMFIVMEFVDGETLRAKKGAISFKQAIDIGIQIADGLAAAHEKGIVHRDIKPENIMIRKDGIAQIMDFGLAKLRVASTRVDRLTKEGSTVGTAGYMSPEQVQGQDVDHRSDIFSLGVLLYELFTGQLPFKGVHDTALMYEIVNVDAVPMSAIKPEIDPELDRIVLECLEKDINERSQSAKQVSIDLKRFKRVSSRQHLSRTMTARPALANRSTEIPTSPETVQRRTPFLHQRVAWGVAILSLLVLVYSLMRTPPREASSGPLIRSSIVVPESIYVHLFSAGAGAPVLSPDGRKLAFVGVSPDGEQRIYVRSLESIECQSVPGTSGAASPFWSPDGKFLGFFANGRMKKVDLIGGSPTTITTAGNPRGGSWGTDGTIIFTPDFQSTIFRVPSDGKEPARQITQLDSTRHEGTHRWPFFLPDGKHFLYLARTASETGEAEGDGIFLGSVDGSTRTFLVQASSNATFVGGEVFFIRGNALMAQQFDPDRLKLDGDPQKVLDGVLFDASYNTAAFGFSNNGLLVYASGEAQAGAPNLVLDRRGNVLLTIGDNSEQGNIRFSPDGQQLALWLYDMRSRRSNVWIYDLRNEGRRRLTATPGGDFSPVWSPDGSEIYFQSTLKGNSVVFRQSTVQNSRETYLYSSPRSNIPLDRTPDGTTLILGTTSNTTSRDGDLWLLPTTGKDPTPRPFQNTRFHEHSARISPDGKWVAFVSDETGEDEVYLKLLGSPESQPWKLTTGGNQSPVWGGSANELIVTNKQNELVALGLQYLRNRPEVASVTKLFRLPPFTTGYDVSPDGKRIVLSRQLEIRKMQPLTLVTNWPHLLEKNKEVP